MCIFRSHYVDLNRKNGHVFSSYRFLYAYTARMDASHAGILQFDARNEVIALASETRMLPVVGSEMAKHAIEVCMTARRE